MAEKILIIGATGYVGGRLTPVLLAQGHEVRVLVRSRAKLEARPWAGHEKLSVTEGDVFQRASLDQALQDCTVVYYLLHSMTSPGDFSAVDRAAAYCLVEALQSSGVKRVVYLSGIVPDDAKTSPHLLSRQEVGRILRLSDRPVTILQASQIIGVGSASFEMLRYLADSLPLIVAPAWLNTKTQPISMTNVLGYLAGLLDHPESAGRTYDIGGPDVVSYRELIDIYTQAAGLPRRRILILPGIPLKAAAAFVGLVTPVPSSLAVALVEGLRNEVVCSDTSIRDLIPQTLFSVREAVGRALGRLRNRDVDTSWLDAGLPMTPEWVMDGDPGYAGGMLYTDAFQARLWGSPESIWPYIERIGGQTGWYSQNILWKLRGFMDRLAGGPGVQRGRRSQEELRVGDSLDFWRVLDIRRGHRLLLLTEMRLPGEGLLDLSLSPAHTPDGAADENPPVTDPPGLPNLTYLTISLYYRPRGLWGKVYWRLVTPFHASAFIGMLQAIARAADAPCYTPPRRAEALPLKR